MVNSIIYVAKIFLYALITFLVYSYANKRYNKTILLAAGNENTKNIMPFSSMLLLSTFVGFYAVICGRVPYGADRQSYALFFEGDWIIKEHSQGLQVIYDFLHLFTNDARVLFFTIGFVCFFITLLAYRKFPNADPKVLFLLMLSTYVIESFYLLKQAPAVALSTIAFAFFYKKKYIPCAIFTIIAISFHETAIILIPLYFALMVSKNLLLRIVSYILLFVLVLFFKPISKILSDLFSSFLPFLSTQLETYLDESGAISIGNNLLTSLKGAPIYIITVVGFMYRNRLKDKIDNYDKFLMICVFSTVTIVLSTFMYWMWRLGLFGFFPIFIFASLLYKEIKKFNMAEAKIFIFSVVILLGFFTFRLLGQFYFIYGGI